MGKASKSKNARLKASRQVEAGEEFVDHMIEDAQEKNLESKADSELFMIDTKGSKRKRRLAAILRDDKEKGVDKMSTHERKKVERMIETGAAKVQNKKGKNKGKAAFDLWGDDNEDDGRQTEKEDPKISTTKRLEKHLSKAGPAAAARGRAAAQRTVLEALPGQSYRPDEAQRQDLVGRAVAVERAREEAVRARRGPISVGLSAETAAVLVGSDHEWSSDEEGADREAAAGAGGASGRALRRKRRADRNRARRRRVGEGEAALARRERRALKDINRAGEIAKALTEEAAAAAQRAEVLKGWRAERAEERLLLDPRRDDPINANSVVVPLDDELHGTMRRMKPKGSMAKEHMEKMVLVGAARAKLDRKGRPGKRIKYRTIGGK